MSRLIYHMVWCFQGRTFWLICKNINGKSVQRAKHPALQPKSVSWRRLRSFSRMSFIFRNSSSVASPLAAASRVSKTRSARWHAVISPLLRTGNYYLNVKTTHLFSLRSAAPAVSSVCHQGGKSMHICIGSVNISNLSCVWTVNWVYYCWQSRPRSAFAVRATCALCSATSR